MGTPRTMRSARWKREANSLIFSHVAVSTGVIVSPETPLYLASIASASNSGSCSCQIFNLSIVTSRTCSLYSERKCIDDSGGRRFFLSRRGHYVHDIHFRCPSHVGCTDLKLFRPSSTREGVIGNSGVAISLGNGWKLLRASLRRSASTSAAHSAAWPDRRSRKAREIRFHLVQDEQDVLRREGQELAKQSDRFVRNGGGGSCRPPPGNDYLNDHEPIGSVRCVVGETGIYQKVILVDLEKAVKAVGSVIAGSHLGF